MASNAATQLMPIGELARRTGTKVPTIRFYEEIGLLPQAVRTAGNHRVYDHSHLDRLTFVRHARELGFSVEDIRDLLRLSSSPDQPCHDIDAIVTKKLAETRSKIARLKSLEHELSRMIDCCGQGKVEECRVIQALADHSLCETDH